MTQAARAKFKKEKPKSNTNKIPPLFAKTTKY